MNLPDNDTGDALRNLVRDGSDLEKPLEMDFFIAVPSESVGKNIAELVTQKGFSCSIEGDTETGEWTCYATKTIIPSYQNVIVIEEYLSTVSKDFGGNTDGFGSYGNAE